MISSLIALPVATALQLRQGFKKTMALAVFFSFLDVMAGLLASYYIGAAPGGITAIVSVLLLLLVIFFQSCSQKREVPHAQS